MGEKLIADLMISIKAYYGVSSDVAQKVVVKITPWVREQLVRAGIPVPANTEPGSERYSLLLARLVESEATAAVVASKK